MSNIIIIYDINIYILDFFIYTVAGQEGFELIIYSFISFSKYLWNGEERAFQDGFWGEILGWGYVLYGGFGRVVGLSYCSDWLGILNTFRTKYYYQIIELSPQIEALNGELKTA